MDALRGLRARLRALTKSDDADRELDEEMRFHLELETERNIAAGMTADEARRRAILSFGGIQRARDAHRDVRGVRWTEEVAADTRYATRALRRAPGLALAVIATLAIGIGATTAIFSAVNAVILRPLPYPDADRLVMAWEENPERGWVLNVVAPANYLDWRKQVTSFQDAAAYADLRGGTATWSGDGEARLLKRVSVTGNFFSTLGVRAALGRTLNDDETWLVQGRVKAGVLSDRAWRQYFGASEKVIGRNILLNGRTVQIVGVMPPGFGYPWPELDIWVPIEFDPSAVATVSFRRAHWLRVVARLKPGVTYERASAELSQVAKRLERDYPQTNRLMGAGITPLHTYLIGDTRRPLMLLLGAVGFLLVLACANIANLLLVQASGRRRETAMRLALGAGRYRLVRQALTESLLLSAIGGVVGLAIGVLGTRALLLLRPPGMIDTDSIGVDWRVVLFVTAVTTLCGVLFGTAPALWNRTRDPADVLKDGGRTATGSRRRTRWDDGLVVVEVAIALVLTCGAGLLTRSFMQLQATDPGFEPRGVLAVRLTAAGQNFRSGDHVAAFFNEVIRRGRGIAGVTDAAATSETPLSRLGWTSDYFAEGKAPGQYGTEATHRRVTPDYFKTMRIRLLRGRFFDAGDQLTNTRVTIINESLARQYFGNDDPIGRRVVFDRVPDTTSIWRTIVGVVADDRQVSYGTPPRPEFFEPLDQSRQSTMSLVFRTTGNPTAIAVPVRRLIAEIDPSVAIDRSESMEAVALRSLARERFLMVLMGIFAGVGLTLSVIGIYGVVSQLARRRRHELGVRLALGAQSPQLQWMIVRHGASVAGVGLAIGLVVAFWATKGLQGMLYQITPSDPATFAGVGLLLGSAAILASWIPARRASRMDPVKVLREE